MNDFERIGGYFSDYYRRAEKVGWVPPVAEDVDRVIRKLNLRPRSGAKALDFSCGEGRKTRHLCDIGYAVTATDVIDAAVDLTKKRLNGRSADIVKIGLDKALPFEDKEFDLILAFHTLQWLRSEQRYLFFIKEFIRTMADDGHLIFTMPTPRNYHNASGNHLGEDVYEVTTEQRKGNVLYSPDLATLKSQIRTLGLDIRLLGHHEFGFEGDESDMEFPLSMYIFCVAKARSSRMAPSNPLR